MNFRFLLFLLASLTMVSFADTLSSDKPTCNQSFNDSFNVRVLDAHFRPVPGADAFIHYQYSGTVGANKTGTYYVAGPKETNESGMAYFFIHNTELDKDKIDCKIDVNGTINGVVGTTKAYANAHPEPVDVQVNVYPIQFFVRDQKSAPIKGATVSVMNESKVTNENGYAILYGPKGKLNYLVSYKEGKQSGSLNVTDDTTYGVVIPYYAIGFDVIDDSGSPLDATVVLGKDSVYIADGRYSNPSVFGNEIDFTITHSGFTKEVKILPAVSNSTKVVFDLHSPIISNITQTKADGSIRLFMNIGDSGTYASGIDPSSVQVSYRVESGSEITSWNKAPAFAVTKDNFAVDFPPFAPNSVVKFKIDAADREGNKASVSGSFTIVPEVVSNNTTQPVTPPEQPIPQTSESTLYYVIGGAVIIILIVFVVFRLKKGGD